MRPSEPAIRISDAKGNDRAILTPNALSFADQNDRNACCRGKNTQFPLVDLFRQSVYSGPASYKDLNDVERVSHDPTFRLISTVGRAKQHVGSEMHLIHVGWRHGVGALQWSRNLISAGFSLRWGHSFPVRKFDCAPDHRAPLDRGNRSGSVREMACPGIG